MEGRMMPEAMWVERARILAFFVLALLVAALVGVFWATPAHADTFTVNSAADSGTDGCDATECTLRGAINAANANDNDPTVDLINFAIPGVGPHTISPASDLPLITEAVTINGYSQTGASADTNGPGQPDNAALKIVLSGAGAGNGLKIEASNSTVQGLVIDNWENGVFLATNATDSQVMGNFIGAGVSGAATEGNNIGVVANGDNNTIGGTMPATRNIISDNGSGIQIGSAMGGNRVQGNYIGTKANGIEPLGNNIGVVIDGSPNNTIGGTTSGARNVISGNSTFGIRIAFPGATLNTVEGNFIGTMADGTGDLGNTNAGVSLQDDAAINIIGGTTTAAR